jgi:hypothetical protein
MFTNGDSMFDDAKLTAINASITCEDLRKILGTGWYVKIKALDMDGEKPCKWNEYPDCNVWSICDYMADHKANIFPVNVYRKVSDKVSLGMLEVGVLSQ